MDFRIESHPSMKLTGLPMRTGIERGRAQMEIADFWMRMSGTEEVRKLQRSIPVGSRIGLAGVCADMEPLSQTFTYLIAIETPADRSNLPDGCVDVTADAGTWAIFEAVGAVPTGVQQTFAQIYGAWFVTSGYEHADGPELEIYPPGDTTSDDYRCEVWIPVVKGSSPRG